MSSNMVGVKRGVPLTVLLVVFALAQVWAVVRGYVVWRKLVDHAQTGQRIVLTGVGIAVLTLVALVGVWMWWRAAVYGFAVIAAVSVVINVVLGVSSLTLLIQLVLLAALGWFIKEKWAAFR